MLKIAHMYQIEQAGVFWRPGEGILNGFPWHFQHLTIPL